MMSTVIKRKKYLAYFKVLIMFFLVFGISLIPPFGQITPLGMKVLGIFIGVLYGWCVLDTLWVSIFAIIAVGYTCNDIFTAFGTGFANQVTLMALLTALLGGALDRLKITDLICNWCLTRNIVKGKPWILLTMFLIAGALIGAFASSIAGTFLLWTILLKLADICHYEKGCKEIGFLIGMVVVVPAVASNCIPFQPGAIFFNSFLTQGTGLAIDYIPFLIYQLTISTIIFVSVCLLAKYVWKLDLSHFDISDDMREDLLNQPITYEQKVGLVAVLIFFVTLLLPGILPLTLPGIAFLKAMGILGVSGAILIALTIMRNHEGESLINIAECHRAVPWNVIWLMVAIAPISDALKSETTGIMATITQYTLPIFSNISLNIFFIGATIILALLTQISVNMVLGAVFIPFLTQICVQLDGNPYILFMMLYTGINMAFLTPAASAYGALMHAHEWIKGRNAYLVGGMNLAITLLVLALIGIPLGNLLF